MKIDSAVRAGQLAAQITAIQQVISRIDIVLSEQWPVSDLLCVAPKEGASFPDGTKINLLAGIDLPIADAWKISVTTARQLHQDKLDALMAELEAL